MENVICEVAGCKDFKNLCKISLRVESISDDHYLYVAPLLQPSTDSTIKSLHICEYNFSSNVWIKRLVLGNKVRLRTVFLSKIDNDTLLICCTDYLSISGTEMCFTFFSFNLGDGRLLELNMQRIILEQTFKLISLSTCQNENTIYMCVEDLLSDRQSLIYRYNLIDKSFKWEKIFITKNFGSGSQFNIIGKRMYCLGGFDYDKQVERIETYNSFENIPYIDLTTGNLCSVNAIPDVQFGFPSIRYWQSTTVFQEYVVMTAGIRTSSVLDDIWLFHFPTSAWIKIPVKVPISLFGHGATLHNQCIYLFGGWLDRTRENPNIRMFKLNVDAALQLCGRSPSAPKIGSLAETRSPSAPKIGSLAETRSPSAPKIGSLAETRSPSAPKIGSLAETRSPSAPKIGSLAETRSPSAPKIGSLAETLTTRECPICFNEHFLLKYLQCGAVDSKHAFCQKCLETLVSNGCDGQIECPECRTRTRLPEGGVKQLPTKIMLTIKCEDCDHVKAIKDQWSCKDCKATVCSTCVLHKHKNHTFARWENFSVPSNCKSRLIKRINSSAVLERKISDYETQIKRILDEIEALQVKISKSQIAKRFVDSLDETFGMLESTSSQEPLDEKSAEKEFRVTLELMKKLNKCSAEFNLDTLMDSIKEE